MSDDEQQLEAELAAAEAAAAAAIAAADALRAKQGKAPKLGKDELPKLEAESDPESEKSPEQSEAELSDSDSDAGDTDDDKTRAAASLVTLLAHLAKKAKKTGKGTSHDEKKDVSTKKIFKVAKVDTELIFSEFEFAAIVWWLRAVRDKAELCYTDTDLKKLNALTLL